MSSLRFYNRRNTFDAGDEFQDWTPDREKKELKKKGEERGDIEDMGKEEGEEKEIIVGDESISEFNNLGVKFDSALQGKS